MGKEQELVVREYVTITQAIDLIGGNRVEGRKKLDRIIREEGKTKVPQMQDHKRKGLHMLLPLDSVLVLLPEGKLVDITEKGREDKIFKLF